MAGNIDFYLSKTDKFYDSADARNLHIFTSQYKHSLLLLNNLGISS